MMDFRWCGSELQYQHNTGCDWITVPHCVCEPVPNPEIDLDAEMDSFGLSNKAAMKLERIDIVTVRDLLASNLAHLESEGVGGSAIGVIVEWMGANNLSFAE